VTGRVPAPLRAARPPAGRRPALRGARAGGSRTGTASHFATGHDRPRDGMLRRQRGLL